MKNESSILYVQTSNAPERQYSPLVLAQSAKAMDIDAAVYYLGMGLTVLKPGAAEEMQVGSFPTVAEMLKKTIDMDRLRVRGLQADARLGERGAHRRRQDRRRGHPERPRPGRRRHDVVLSGSPA